MTPNISVKYSEKLKKKFLRMNAVAYHWVDGNTLGTLDMVLNV